MTYFLMENPIVIIMAAVIYIGLMGGLGSWLAEKKGYSTGSWFFLCVLTGPVGLIVLAGAPSRGIESSLEEIRKRLEAKFPEDSLGGVSETQASGQTWFCSKCQTENLAGTNSCRGCGEPRL